MGASYAVVDAISGATAVTAVTGVRAVSRNRKRLIQDEGWRSVQTPRLQTNGNFQQPLVLQGVRLWGSGPAPARRAKTEAWPPRLPLSPNRRWKLRTDTCSAPHREQKSCGYSAPVSLAK